jgi:hypothetical protein
MNFTGNPGLAAEEPAVRLAIGGSAKKQPGLVQDFLLKLVGRSEAGIRGTRAIHAQQEIYPQFEGYSIFHF